MFSFKRSILLSLLCAAVCHGEVWIELIPSPPPPHYPGQVVTLDVYAHSEIPYDRYIKKVQLDFSDSNPLLSLGPTFVFDLSAAGNPQDFTVSPALPVPWTQNLFEYGCDPCFLYLPALGVLHIGSVLAQLPAFVGVYRVDVLNAYDPDPSMGALIKALSIASWRAYTGEITGGTYDFFVGLVQGVPAVSASGVIVIIAALVGIGSFILWKRRDPTTFCPPAICFAAVSAASGGPVAGQVNKNDLTAISVTSESIFDVCGADNREPDTEKRVGRLRFMWKFSPIPCSVETYCTAFLFNG
jgi:hypothetical protein